MSFRHRIILWVIFETVTRQRHTVWDRSRKAHRRSFLHQEVSETCLKLDDMQVEQLQLLTTDWFTSWVAGVLQWLWSPRGCPPYPTTCDPKPQTSHPTPATTGGSGSAMAHTHTIRLTAAHKASRVKFDFDSLGVFERSLMEQKALPVYTPVTVRLRRRQAVITGQTLTLRLSLCPGLLSRQVTTKHPHCPAQPLLSPGSSHTNI